MWLSSHLHPPGVSWEDEARAHLAANGAVAAIDRSMPVAEIRRILSGIKEWHPIGDLCRKAESVIWDVIESDCPIKDSPREEIAALGKVAKLLNDGKWSSRSRAASLAMPRFLSSSSMSSWRGCPKVSR